MQKQKGRATSPSPGLGRQRQLSGRCAPNTFPLLTQSRQVHVGLKLFLIPHILPYYSHYSATCLFSLIYDACSLPKKKKEKNLNLFPSFFSYLYNREGTVLQRWVASTIGGGLAASPPTVCRFLPHCLPPSCPGGPRPSK